MRDGRIEQVGTPFEIYNRPATAFVASFIGSLNVLQRDRGGSRRREGRRRRAGDRRGGSAPAAERAGGVRLSLRPEMIALQQRSSREQSPDGHAGERRLSRLHRAPGGEHGRQRAFPGHLQQSPPRAPRDGSKGDGRVPAGGVRPPCPGGEVIGRAGQRGFTRPAFLTAGRE